MKNLAFDWNELKFFLGVARHGSLSAAAAALSASPSTVSRHIDALESRLGMTLFVRQSSGYLPTDQGSALLEYMDGVETAILAAEHAGRVGTNQSAAGLIRVATTEMLAMYLIGPAMNELHQRHPDLQVHLHTALTPANLSRREADLSLRVIGPDVHDGDYIAIRAAHMPFALYCAPSLLPDPGRTEANWWRRHPYVGWDETSGQIPTARWLQDLFARPTPDFASNSLEMQARFMRHGLGIGALPTFIGDGDAQLASIDGTRTTFGLDLWLMYHRDLKASQRVVAMRDFLMDLVAKTFPTSLQV